MFRPSQVLALILALAACGCASEQENADAPKAASGSAAATYGTPPAADRLELTPVRIERLPGWNDDRQNEAIPALLQSCARLAKRAATDPLGSAPVFGRASQWQQICRAAERVPPHTSAARSFLRDWFQAYQATNGTNPTGLFTGYYEPVLRGSWRRGGAYRVPVYRPPGGSAGRTLPSRAQIEAGALSGRGLELLWLDDAVDAFFMHIQGSGRVQMDDGSLVRIGFAGKNGHPYVPIGAELIRRGEIPQEQMSMQAIRGWLAANPAQAPALMRSNPSYVFFRMVDGDGPIGAQGVPLTALRSLAVDPYYVPYSVPIWLDTSDPTSGGSPLRLLAVAQDTGGAIRGPVRGDLYCGSGDVAGRRAGLMKQEGRWFLLLPRAAAVSS